MVTVLVVDDEPLILVLCERMLGLGKYAVFTAGSGEEALRYLQKNTVPIDLALLDVMMPGMNGVELAGWIQNAAPSTRVVLMTGFRPGEVGRLIKNAAWPVIWKPFRVDSFLQALKNALEDRPVEPLGPELPPEP